MDGGGKGLKMAASEWQWSGLASNLQEVAVANDSVGSFEAEGVVVQRHHLPNLLALLHFHLVSGFLLIHLPPLSNPLQLLQGHSVLSSIHSSQDLCLTSALHLVLLVQSPSSPLSFLPSSESSSCSLNHLVPPLLLDSGSPASPACLPPPPSCLLPPQSSRAHF